MNSSQRLRINLTDESKAYGYTLCIWGSGAVLINQFNLPTPEIVLTYVFGAVLGFGLLASAVYHGVLVEVKRNSEQKMIVASMIHFLAALGTVWIATLLTRLDTPRAAFFLAGMNATVTYNILMLAEVFLSRELRTLEDRLLHTISHPQVDRHRDATDGN